MKVSFVLPAYYRHPIGGYHVHFNYANRLTQKGHNVTIIFPRYCLASGSWKGRVWAPVWSAGIRLRNRPLLPFFNLHPDVRVKFVPDLRDESLPKADILIATAWQTAEAVQHASPKRGRKYYISYDYEFWRTVSSDLRIRIAKTFHAGFRIIATSGAVEGMLGECGCRAFARIPCGVDFAAFGLDNPVAQREGLTLGFPARPQPFKGCADALEAVEGLRRLWGDALTVIAFGGGDVELPNWIHQLKRPSRESLRAFYNKIAIFLVPSHFEGWGLPGAEAMACGSCLVTTDNGGASDYAVHEVTALVVPPREPTSLIQAADRLLRDQKLRVRLALSGNERIQVFRWDRAADELERALLES